MKTLALLILFSTSAHAGDALECRLARGASPIFLKAPIVENQADVKTTDTSELGLGLDASLAPSSFLVVVQDDSHQKRLAFTGSPAGASSDASLLELGESQVQCAQRLEKVVSLAPPPPPAMPDYLVCMLDEARFVNGEPQDQKRRLVSVNSPLNSTMPLSIAAADETVSFRVRYVSFDPFHGLDVVLTDKTSGETAHFTGPARTMLPSFLMALTQGDKAKDARFLRLGCVWTNDPKSYKTL